MSAGWAKLHNDLWSSRKWMSISLAAQGLWTTAIAYSNTMRTYGQLDGHLLPLFRGTTDLAQELVEAGLWDLDGDGWQIHDWDDHQTSREQAETVSAKRAAAGRKGGQKSRLKRTANPTEVSVTSDSKQSAKQTEATRSKSKQEEEVEVEEEQLLPPTPQGELLPAPERSRTVKAFVYPDAFEAFWAVWPKRRSDTAGKKAAHMAWDRAVNGTSKKAPRITAAELQAAVERYAADTNLPPENFIPNATTWLNNDRWENGPLPPRGGLSGRPQAGDTHRAMERSFSAAQSYRALEEAGYYDQSPQITSHIRRTA